MKKQVFIESRGDLETIVAHYDAIKILLQSVKNNNDQKALDDWNSAIQLKPFIKVTIRFSI